MRVFAARYTPLSFYSLLLYPRTREMRFRQENARERSRRQSLVLQRSNRAPQFSTCVPHPCAPLLSPPLGRVCIAPTDAYTDRLEITPLAARARYKDARLCMAMYDDGVVIAFHGRCLEFLSRGIR